MSVTFKCDNCKHQYGGYYCEINEGWRIRKSPSCDGSGKPRPFEVQVSKNLKNGTLKKTVPDQFEMKVFCDKHCLEMYVLNENLHYSYDYGYYTIEESSINQSE